MRDNKRGPQATPLPHPATTRSNGNRFRLGASCLLGLIATTCLLLAACVGGGTKQGQQPRAIAYNDTGTHGKTMEQLLAEYDNQRGKQRLSTANRMLGIVYRMELADTLVAFTPETHPDSMDLWVWYWASEYFYDTQDYDKGLAYARRALPLAGNSHNLELRADCQHTAGLLYFRLSDYANAIKAVRGSLDTERRMNDKSRISSSLNSLAGICLVAKQLDDAERYIDEALDISKRLKDSTRIAIQYGMSSEIHHIMGKERQALDDARQAYAIDSARGNTAKVGIRLAQMASAEAKLGRLAQAESHLREAMPIFAKTGNATSLAVCQNQMGEMLNQRGSHEEAADYFRRAAESFAQLRDLYNESRAQRGLYEALKNSNPKQAAIHMGRYASLKDSIYHHDMEQAVSQYKVKYETEKLALQHKRESMAKRVNLIVGIVLVAALLLVIGWLIWLAKLRRRRHLKLRADSQMRTRFFTNITHEFRTPLTLIIGLSHDLVADTGIKEEARQKAQTINRQGNSLLTLTNQLLDVAKVKSEVGNANWRNGNLTAYVTMIVESYRDYARSRDINLNFIVQDDVVMDFVPDYVGKVMNNLLSNAIKFTPPYGKVSVNIRREGGHLLLDVADTGRGMDKETTDHVFDPFFQAEDDSANIGTGIGLALVKQIVDALGGNIGVESEPGKGSAFHIRLPIHNNIKKKMEEKTIADQPAAPHATALPADSGGTDNDCRLLIIEDNHDVAAYIGAQLGASGRYALYYAVNGREGLEKALQLVPDLIITDLMMPGMDGLEVCRQVRANDIVNHVPIIVVTAKITEEERIEGLQAGADAYLAKPFNADELRTRVEKLLESRRLMREKFASIAKGGCGREPKDEAGKPCEADLRFLTKVADVVHTQLNHNRETSVAAVASMMCMSNSQFYRKMVAVTGYTPVAYIQRIRIRKAMKMMTDNPHTPLSEVADRCGFDVYPNFVRAFKNVCGTTPTEYRKRQELK